MIRYKSLLCLILVIISNPICSAFEYSAWYSTLEKGLTSYQPEKIPESPDAGILYEWELNAKQGDHFWKQSEDDTSTGDAILNLWRAKKNHLLELLWWKSRNPETRLLILSLFKGSYIEGIDQSQEVGNVPSFNPSRFESNEAKERQQELEYVETNRKKIHSLLKKYDLLPFRKNFNFNHPQ